MRATLELWLVRHGETPRSRDGLLAGWVDTPLTRRGVHEARALRPLLAGQDFDGVWASDLRRAVRTAREAWGEPRRDRRLREISFGELEGPGDAGTRSRSRPGSFPGFSAPAGETLDDLAARVHLFIASLPTGRHLVFTHGGVVRLLTRAVGLDEFLPTGSVAVVDWTARSSSSFAPRTARSDRSRRSQGTVDGRSSANRSTSR